MKEGLLWFDNDPKRKLAEKVKQAASRYQAKLRCKPTVCYLNAEEYDGATMEINGIYLKPVSHIRPNYYWIGVEQNSVQAKAA